MGNKNIKQKAKAKTQKAPFKSAPKTISLSRQQLLILLLLLLAVFVVYIPALNKDFINYDDDLYIMNNPLIRNFSFSNLPQIFGHFYQAQYSPIPTVLYGIVNSLGGKGEISATLFNLTGILLHLITTILVFQFIWNLYRNFRVAFLTMALFGLCTLQVESVAWLAAVFKTGTYSIFFISSLTMYVKYVNTKKIKFFLFSLLLFFLSCFCKEQAVALSLAVIVIDLYYRRRVFSGKVLLEKLPFFALSVALGLLTIAATKSNKEIYFESSFSILDRIIYAGYAVCLYVAKLIVPFKLSLFYPYPSLKSNGALYLIFPVIAVALIGVWFWAVMKKKSAFVLFGGLFFMVNILFSLALQVISVREVVMADRYVYLASIGVFFLIAKGADILVEKKQVKFPLVASILGVYLLLTGVLTFSRTQVWKNSETVMTDAIEKYRYPLAYVNRGYYYRKHKEYDKALVDYTNAIIVKPDYALAYHNRGTIYFYTNRDSLGYIDYSKAIELDPKNSESWSNRGAILARGGKYEAALKDLDHAIQLDPTKDVAFLNRALTFVKLNRYKDALADFDSYLKLVPDDAPMYSSRGVAKQNLGMYKESLEDFDKAISIDPQGDYYLTRSYSWNALGDKAKAMADVQTAVKLGSKVDPNYVAMLKQ